MNLPNKITLARIFMTIIVIFLCLFPFYSLGINFPKYNVSGIIVDLKYIYEIAFKVRNTEDLNNIMKNLSKLDYVSDIERVMK